MFVERYSRLHEISGATVRQLTPDGVELLIRFIQHGGGAIDLGLDLVVALLPETATPNQRDHLIRVHLATVESLLYRNGHETTGHLVRHMVGRYGVATEEEKLEMIRNGFPCRVGTVASAEELAALTPLKRVTNVEYSSLYDRLLAAWGSPRQRQAGTMMEERLATIHDLLPRHKIGDDFRRVRAGREEPLPMYVRNEISHPTVDGLLETKAFQEDMKIGYAIMEAWMAAENQAQ